MDDVPRSKYYVTSQLCKQILPWSYRKEFLKSKLFPSSSFDRNPFRRWPRRQGRSSRSRVQRLSPLKPNAITLRCTERRTIVVLVRSMVYLSNYLHDVLMLALINLEPSLHFVGEYVYPKIVRHRRHFTHFSFRQRRAVKKKLISPVKNDNE